MRSPVLIDTNVAVTANRGATHASPDCVLSCIRALKDLRETKRILVDQLGFIMREYRRHLAPAGQPGTGDMFFKWLWDNQGNPQLCRHVVVTVNGNPDRSFEEFPDDMELSRFDRSDRIFVAVALASRESPPILNATDSDWTAFERQLANHGVRVQFLCSTTASIDL